MKLLTLCTFLVAIVPGHAAWTPVWSIGTKDGDRAPLSAEAWVGNTSPTATSSTTHDNDFFFAGTYAAPVGVVAATEPWANFEGSLSTWDDVTRIHFQLTAGQASSTGQLRFRVFPIWGGYVDGDSFGTHQLRIRLNGTVINTWTFTGQDMLRVTFNAAPAAVAGANVLELMRTGGTANAWFAMDALVLEADATALVDADGDGLPQTYEVDHSLNDNFAGDAAQDPDFDGLTNLQERAAGTDPHDADSDDDGLSDSAEVTTNKLVADSDGDTVLDGAEITAGTNPLAIDSDSDGAPDAWELRVGTNAMLASSTPPSFAASIGVKFTSEEAPTNIMSPYAVTGFVPQMNWNNTRPLSQWQSASIAGTQAKLISPTAGVLVNSSGAASGATISWSANATWKSGNSGGSTQELLNGGLWTNSNDPQATVSFASVPFATYDVIVYVGNTYSGGSGYVRLNDQSSTDRHFQSWSAAPVAEFVEPVSNSSLLPRIGNTIVFRQVTGSSVSVKLFRSNWDEVGIHAVQLVSTTLDGDGDGMTDAFEVTHRLNRSANDAAGDLDNDGLSNVAEQGRRTNPRLADTDGDGLSDAVETATGVWVSASNTGSNPLHADSDGDTLGDGAEVNAQPRGTNPNLADSDGDGRDDPTELAQNTDPTNTTAPQLVPVRSGNNLNWTLYMQVIWDHEHANLTDESWGERQFFWMEVQNRQDNLGGRAMGFSLRSVGGVVTPLFSSSAAGAFSAPGDPSSDLWHGDWNNPPADLSTALGFSGYGRVDTSDRLRVRVQASTTGAASAWTVTFSVHNLDTNQTLHTQTFTNCTLAANAHSGTVTWTDENDVPNRLYQTVRSNFRVQFLPTATAASIETLPAYGTVRDTDKDGMPDFWEMANSLNSGSAADAPLDPDGDGLSNVREYVLGTNPRNADSDGDGARDGVEMTARSNPLLASSKPPFWSGLPVGTVGEDLNGNGMSDAFELSIGRFDLLGAGDNDGDGMTNAQESVAGTDPLSALSRLWVDSLRTGSDLTVCWPRLLRKSHQLQRSTDFVSWANVSGSPAVVGDEYQQTVPNAITGPRAFFRARVNDLDTDGDGVSDWTEANVLGSSTTSSTSLGSAVSMDTNNDGTPETTISGDYAALAERVQGALPTATSVSQSSAARFLVQATFGPTLDDIARVQQLGYSGWIAEQKAASPTWHSPYIRAIHADLYGPHADRRYNANEEGTFLFGNNMSTTFARAAIQGSDQLRQRVAFALSQILVTSRRDANLENQILGMSDYYDLFVRHAFGNYEELLMQVTMHPVMGRYLSHVGNQKARPEINQYPDENYAREVMQLFTIGLWKLNPDGTRQVNGSGQNIPTYSNTEITQLARVLTGLWFGQHHWGQGGWSDIDYITPMTMHADRHDFDAKTLIDGFTLPAREPTQEAAMLELRAAIRHLVQHANTGPFIGRQLIQFLVTDNPSPAFVQRVAAVFANNGSGVRGDLGAVISAILLDDEARNPAVPHREPSYGRLKEPVIRAMAMGRAFGLRSVPELHWWNWSEFYDAARQEPTFSPSVFNFYRPDYRAPGAVTAQQKSSPVFQITDSYSSIAFPNKLWDLVSVGFEVWQRYSHPLDLTREAALSATPEKLVDHLNLLVCAGSMSAGSRTIILNALNQMPATNPDARARVAVYLALVCPEGAVMK